MLSPRHLTHGMPFFIDLQAGIIQWGGNWGLQPLPMPVPGQTYRVMLPSGDVDRARINNAGFRGEDFTLEKRPGVVRIATMGASSTFGFGNRDSETYPHQLEKILAEQCPQTQFEVYNFGIPFLNSFAIAGLYRDKVADYKPDVVTFYEGVNDTGALPSGALSEAWNKIRSVSLIAEFLNVPVRDLLASYSREDVNEGLSSISEKFIANVNFIANNCAQPDCLFLPATQQAKSYLIASENMQGVSYAEEYLQLDTLLNNQNIGPWQLCFLRHHRLMSDLRDWAARSHAQLVDVQKAMDNDRQHLTSWVHLDPEGNVIVARTLANEIVQRYCK